MANRRPKFRYVKNKKTGLVERFPWPSFVRQGPTARSVELTALGIKGHERCTEVEIRVRTSRVLRDLVREAAAERSETVARFARKALEDAVAARGKM